MVFKIGAAFKGLATELVDKQKEEDKRVDLLVDKALDLGTQRYYQKKDKRDNKIEETTELINQLSGYFGGNLETAASIARGGKAHAEKMMLYFEEGRKNGISASDIYTYTPSGNQVGYDTSEQFAQALVKPVSFEKPTMAQQTDSMLGSSMDVAYNERLEEMKSLGLIPNEVAEATSYKFGKSSIDLSKLPTKPQTLQEQYASNFRKLQNKDLSAEERDIIEDANVELITAIRKMSIAKGADDSDSTLTFKNNMDAYKLIKQEALDSVGYSKGTGGNPSTVRGPNGEILIGDEADKVYNEAINNAKVNFVESNLLNDDGSYRSGGEDIARVLNLGSIVKNVQSRILGGEQPTEGEEKKLSFDTTQFGEGFAGAKSFTNALFKQRLNSMNVFDANNFNAMMQKTGEDLVKNYGISIEDANQIINNEIRLRKAELEEMNKNKFQFVLEGGEKPKEENKQEVKKVDIGVDRKSKGRNLTRRQDTNQNEVPPPIITKGRRGDRRK